MLHPKKDELGTVFKGFYQNSWQQVDHHADLKKQTNENKATATLAVKHIRPVSA